jgi:hypothetical protein
LEGVAATPVDGVPSAAGFAVTFGGEPWHVAWSDAERGWILSSSAGDSAVELGRTTSAGLEPVLASTSMLLADGRLFRLSFSGAAAPSIEVGRWDLPGAYLVARSRDGAWELERTVAGSALGPPMELLILTCIEIGRLDGWYEESR